MHEFDPKQAHNNLNNFLASPFPCDVLAEAAAQVPQKIPYDLTTELRKQGDFESLLLLSLPHVSSLYEKHSHFDLDRQELFAICVSCVADEIQQWQPANPPSQQDYLSHRLDDRTKRKVETTIAEWYGLKHCQYPILAFYFQAQAQFQQEEGREAGCDELPRLKECMKELLEAAENAQEKRVVAAALNPAVDKDDSWHGDTLNMIHQHHCSQAAGKARHPLEANPDYDASFLPDSVETTLRSLSQEERKLLVLRFWNNLTEREIAKQLGMSKSKVGNTLQKIFRKLRHPLRACLLRDWLR